LFGNGEPGFTFEPWDITTLYQDRAGTTPVTAAGQSVGLRLSKDKGLRQGPELVTNGTFGANITGWSNTGASISVWESGAARWSTSTAEFSGFRSASFATVVGRTYEFTATVLENTGSAWRIVFVNGDGSFSNGTDNYTTPGTRTARFIATQTTSFVEIRNGTAATANRLIDNISVRELAGNHEVAISDAKRGVYGWMPKTGRRNLLTYSEQFDDAAWAKFDLTVTPNNAVAPDGTLTADTLVGNTANSVKTIRQISLPSTVGTFTVYAKAAGETVISVWLVGASVGANFTLTGAGSTALQGATSSSITAVGNGWYRCQVYHSSATTTAHIYLRTGGGFVGDGVSGVHIWGAQLETGSTATAYQRVNSQYDVTEAGVPTCYYVQADGVDDAYVTPTITPNTDKVQVFAGVRKLSDAAIGALLETSANSNSNNGALWLLAPGSPGSSMYSFRSKGTAAADTNVTGYVAPITNIVSGLGDISADRSTIRVNGAQVGQNTADQGTGNYLAYPAYIYSRGGTSLPFNGLDFGHAVRFGPNLDATTIARVEALIARNTPEVTL